MLYHYVIVEASICHHNLLFWLEQNATPICVFSNAVAYCPLMLTTTSKIVLRSMIHGRVVITDTSDFAMCRVACRVVGPLYDRVAPRTSRANKCCVYSASWLTVGRVKLLDTNMYSSSPVDSIYIHHWTGFITWLYLDTGLLSRNTGRGLSMVKIYSKIFEPNK